MRSFLLPAILAAIAGLSGCYYDNEETLYPNSYCNMSDITFNTSVKKIFETNCTLAQCHGTISPQSIDLTTHTSIAANKDKIMNRAIVVKDMPKGGKLSDCDYNKLKKWLEAGAQNN